MKDKIKYITRTINHPWILAVIFGSWFSYNIYSTTRNIQSNLSPHAIYIPFDILNEKLLFKDENEDVK